MKKLFTITSLLLLSVLGNSLFAQVGQVNISRVQSMPNLPSPYKMRNWKDVAVKYDQFIFNTTATGQYLPLARFKSSGINYPSLQPILLDTYVGSASSGSQAEAINIMPAIVGATLMGIDKSNQNGIDWTSKTKDFFNKANGQKVYLNGYSAVSGNDWWYDLMPNVFFYQLYSQYPSISDYDVQFKTVADQWLNAVNVMGGSSTPYTIPQMNYRAFNLITKVPLNEGVIEPEAAGAISWLLYNAYKKTGQDKYLAGAQMSMDFLSSLTTSPSYELQLPYGTLMAAKMNAELGANYDVEKMLNWSFNRGPLRGWGTIVGNWNGSDVSGLIGEANDGGNDYAFTLNGFQQAAALVPLVKYDKRFARAIGKWALNIANASRLYYSKYLPVASQDDYSWSATNDTQSVIAYEALKENINGNKLYGTGDAKRNGWAQTNLGLYGSSSVGYLAAVIDTTDVSGVLRLDVNRTDFFGQNVYPSYIIYNPYATVKQITLPLGAQSYDIYNAISETVILTNVTGDTPLSVPADQALLLVYLPTGSTLQSKDGKLYVGNNVVDYNLGYNFGGNLRIKSLTSKDSVVIYNQQVPIYAAIENPAGDAVTYNWYVNDVLTSSANSFTWPAPAVTGKYEIKLNIISGALSDKDSFNIKVLDRIPVPPIIQSISSDTTFYYVGTNAALRCNATNSIGGILTYNWTLPDGSINSQTDSQLNWKLPTTEGIYVIMCTVANSDNLTASFSRQILVKKQSTGTTAPFAYYSLDGNVLDNSGNGHDAILKGAVLVADSRNKANKAYKFSTGDDVISVNNSQALNFQDQITLSFWIKLDDVPEESFVLSHGSYEERWKISLTPDKKMRWTIRTGSTVTDLDSSFPLNLNRWYHFTALYSSYSMELYADGILNSFLSNSGQMSVSTKALTFGKKDIDISNYFLRGTLDEVRIYDKGLEPDEIFTLKTIFSPDVVTGLVESEKGAVVLYPNPSHGVIHVANLTEPVKQVELMDITGRKINMFVSEDDKGNLEIEFSKSVHGLLIVKIEMNNGILYRKIIAE